MNGPIAQIDTFFPENSTCTFCDRVNFVELQKSLFGKTKEKEVAKTPDDWFVYLKASGCRGIRLSRTPQNAPHIPDRMSAGFVGGGGTWVMEVLFPNNRSEYWVARWEVWNQNAPGNRIWRVTYGRVSAGATSEFSPPELADVAQKLEKSLKEIHAFSKKHDCSGFTKWFEDALDTLESEGRNLHGYHKDLAPEGFMSKEAVSILHACQKSWVFGGMGS